MWINQQNSQEKESWKWKQMMKQIYPNHYKLLYDPSHFQRNNKEQSLLDPTNSSQYAQDYKNKIENKQIFMPILDNRNQFMEHNYEHSIGGITVQELNESDVIKVITYSICACRNEASVPDELTYSQVYPFSTLSVLSEFQNDIDSEEPNKDQ